MTTDSTEQSWMLSVHINTAQLEKLRLTFVIIAFCQFVKRSFLKNEKNITGTTSHTNIVLYTEYISKREISYVLFFKVSLRRLRFNGR